MPDEIWKPITNWPEYEVSNRGQVRSLDRRVPLRGNLTRLARGQILGGGRLPTGHRHVTLCRDGQEFNVFVYRLVLQEFDRPAKPKEMGLHKDDNPFNDDIENLYWGSSSDNGHDSVRNGRHHSARRPSCAAGHEYPSDVSRTKRGARICKICMAKYQRTYEVLRGKRVRNT